MGRNAKQECLTLYPEIARVEPKLTDNQLGKLMRALIRYRFAGISMEFEMDATLDIVFELLKDQVDRMEQVKKRNSENAKRRWENQALPVSEAQEESPAVVAGITVDMDEYQDDTPF